MAGRRAMWSEVRWLVYTGDIVRAAAGGEPGKAASPDLRRAQAWY